MNFIKLLWTVMFLQFSVVPEGGGADVEAKETVRSWAEEGKKAGLRIAALLEKGENVMKDTLLKFAAKIAGQPSAEDWLTGYASAFTVEQTRRNRKSEAKALFSAWASNHPVERVVGLNEDKTPMKETKTVQEWLGDFKGTYHAFITLCREMAPRVGDNSTNTGTKRAAKLTEKQSKKMLELLDGATGTQADSIVAKATKHLLKVPGWEAKFIGHIVGMCNEIKMNSKDEKMVDGAAQIIDLVHGMTVSRGVVAPAAIPAAAAAVETAPAANNEGGEKKAA